MSFYLLLVCSELQQFLPLMAILARALFLRHKIRVKTFCLLTIWCVHYISPPKILVTFPYILICVFSLLETSDKKKACCKFQGNSLGLLGYFLPFLKLTWEYPVQVEVSWQRDLSSSDHGSARPIWSLPCFLPFLSVQGREASFAGFFVASSTCLCRLFLGHWSLPTTLHATPLLS